MGVFFLGEHFNTEPAHSLAATLATNGVSWGCKMGAGVCEHILSSHLGWVGVVGKKQTSAKG